MRHGSSPDAPAASRIPYDRISVLVSAILLGLVLSLLMNLPSQSYAFIVLGSPVTLTLSKSGLVTLVLTTMTAAGVDSLVRAHPRARRQRVPLAFCFWILPGVVVLLSSQLLFPAVRLLLALRPGLPLWAGWALALLGVGTLLSLTLALEYQTVDPAAAGYNSARLLLTAFTHLVALALFILIYHAKARSLLSATATLATASLLALDLLRNTPGRLRRALLYAGIVGLVMGQAVWALNYWRVNSLAAGTLLLLFFYVATGLSQQYLQGALTRRVLAEFALMTLVGIGLLVRYGLR